MDKSEYLKRYGEMVVIRHLEERASALYQQGKIGGFLHLYSGQEAVSTGLISARQPQDRVITAYRDHGVAINCGVPAKQVMAELLGKATGISKGKGGSMHMADVSKNELQPDTPLSQFFVIAKQATIRGYYTSEIGIHRELRYKGNQFLQEFVGCGTEDGKDCPHCGQKHQ